MADLPKPWVGYTDINPLFQKWLRKSEQVR